MHCPVSCLIHVFYVLVYVNKINDYDEIILYICFFLLFHSVLVLMAIPVIRMTTEYRDQQNL